MPVSDLLPFQPFHSARFSDRFALRKLSDPAALLSSRLRRSDCDNAVVDRYETDPNRSARLRTDSPSPFDSSRCRAKAGAALPDRVRQNPGLTNQSTVASAQL